MSISKKMLIVDDEEINREILEDIFEDDFQLMLVESGEAALEAIPEFIPGIIVLDVMMGGIDGYETCRQIRSNPDSTSMIVIMVSARALETDIQKGLDAGANLYITKPFTSDEIKMKVNEMRTQKA